MTDAGGGRQPTSGAEWRKLLRQHADLLKHLRDFMAEHGVMEVDTPMLTAAPNWDPSVASFAVPLIDGSHVYLRSSPESAMKCLLAAGSDAIYSMGKVFRRDERGRWHEPEFTMLEWYRPGFDRQQLQDEVSALLASLGLPVPSLLSYQQAFVRHAGIDPHAASAGELEAVARRCLSDAPRCRDRREWLDWLLTAVVVPACGSAPFFLCDYPADSPAQAALLPDPPARADRFELFINGMETANGCVELREADEFLRRWRHENESRRRYHEPELPLDHDLLHAMRQGLPPCAGVALGVDRLLLALHGGDRLADVNAFLR